MIEIIEVPLKKPIQITDFFGNVESELDPKAEGLAIIDQRIDEGYSVLSMVPIPDRVNPRLIVLMWRSS